MNKNNVILFGGCLKSHSKPFGEYFRSPLTAVGMDVEDHQAEGLLRKGEGLPVRPGRPLAPKHGFPLSNSCILKMVGDLNVV